MNTPGGVEMTFGFGTVNQLEVAKEANDFHSMKGLQVTLSDFIVLISANAIQFRIELWSDS